MNDILQEIENKKKDRIIACGRAASGKDFMRKKLQEKGFVYGVSYTTRPPRTGEIDGEDYFFLSKEDFQKMIDDNSMYEFVEFNNWIYGTTKEQFYNEDIFIMTPKGISHITKEDREKSFIIYLDIDEEVRKKRLLQRSDADSVDRRLLADNLDFAEFTNYDIKITNHDF